MVVWIISVICCKDFFIWFIICAVCYMIFMAQLAPVQVVHFTNFVLLHQSCFLFWIQTNVPIRNYENVLGLFESLFVRQN